MCIRMHMLMFLRMCMHEEEFRCVDKGNAQEHYLTREVGESLPPARLRSLAMTGDEVGVRSAIRLDVILHAVVRRRHGCAQEPWLLMSSRFKDILASRHEWVASLKAAFGYQMVTVSPERRA